MLFLNSLTEVLIFEDFLKLRPRHGVDVSGLLYHTPPVAGIFIEHEGRVRNFLLVRDLRYVRGLHYQRVCGLSSYDRVFLAHVNIFS